MTEYYTNKSDFEQGKRIGWFEDNVSQVKDLLKDISETAEIVKSNDLSHLYIAKGGATLGKDMPEKTFVDSEHTVLDVMEEMKRVHREIVQNIENKYISGLEDAMEALNKINEGKNKYKSEHLTYEETYTYQTTYQTGYGIQTAKGKRKAYYSLSDILNSDKSPISSAAAKYQDKLKVAKENLAKLEAEDKETYDKIKDLSEKELVETFFPTELGEYKRLKSTWSKDNEWWLGWVDIGVKVVGTAALVVGTFASGGTLAPVALALGTTLLGGEAAYRAISGETITGDVLTNEQRIWAGAEAVTTLVSGGLGSYLKGASIAERTVSQGVLNADKVARFGANAYDVAQFGHDFIEDPQMALTNLATSQLIGRTVGHLGQRFQAYRASKAADVNLGSGKAASYKGSIQERLSNTWTDVKTKAGNVRAQASQSWDDFKTKANNTKNRALASGAEKVSEKLDNLNAAWGAQKQNFQRNLAAMQGNLAPEFQLAGGAPGIGVNPNFSESMENLSQKIQQFSVKRRQQIQDFEGVGGSSKVSTPHSDASSLENSNWGSDALSDLRKKWNVPETDTIAVGKTDIPGLEDRVFEGGSPKVRKEAGLPDLDDAFPDREVRSSGKISSATRHAEENVANNFIEAIKEAELNAEDVTGTLKIHQSNPKGVCPTCLSGLGNPAKPSGVIKQLSEMFPKLRIEVTSEIVEGVKVNGRLQFVVENGLYVVD
ncbi:hypothetical protein [Streptococcus sanguinis]|uniref:hypothetical protein n=1 Tax=Streptococcus sanguinis TaxID=1305 RepID=UPI001CBC0308|nr:hypothetical protein [Streptococcus sanguinis]MCC3164840.1 hypothetical protein [Streptococcus sanguinis]